MSWIGIGVPTRPGEAVFGRQKKDQRARSQREREKTAARLEAWSEQLERAADDLKSVVWDLKQTPEYRAAVAREKGFK